MKWIEVKVIFDCTTKELATDLISNIFYDLGLKGVVVEDPDIKPVEENKACGNYMQNLRAGSIQ